LVEGYFVKVALYRKLAGLSANLRSSQITVVVNSDELLPGNGSYVEELTVAVSITALPIAAVTFTVSTSVMTPLLARLGAVQVTVPVSPAAGAMHDPLLTDTLLNVVPAGIASWMLTSFAASGPLLFTTIVYVSVAPLGITVGAKL
jgi:hypothetical protein